jgi:hypothetical protein
MPTWTPVPARGRRVRSGLLLVWIAAAVAYGAFVAERWRSRGPTDFYLLWSVGQALREMPLDNVYSESDRRAITAEFAARAETSGSPARVAAARGWNRFETISTPFLYTVFALASSGDFDRDYRRFQIVSLCGYLATVFGIAIAVGFPGWLAFVALVAATAVYWPFYTDAGFGNVGQLQVGLIGLFLAASRRDGAAAHLVGGCVLGLLLVFKPTVVFAAALLAAGGVVQRQWRRLAFQGLGASLACGIGWYLPTALFGSACTWGEWRRHAPAIFLTDRYLAGGFLGQLFGPLPRWVFPLFGAALLATTLHLVRRGAVSRQPFVPSLGRSAAADPLTLTAIGLAIFVVTAPVAHSHYFVLVVPLALVAMGPSRPVAARLAAGAASLLVALHPVWKSLGWTDARNHSLWTFAGTWGLLVLVVGGLGRPTRGRGESRGLPPESVPAGAPPPRAEPLDRTAARDECVDSAG